MITMSLQSPINPYFKGNENSLAWPQFQEKGQTVEKSCY